MARQCPMVSFSQRLQANPVYRAETKRVPRKLRRYETQLALAGLVYGLLMAACVTLAELHLNVPIPLQLPAIHATFIGVVLAIAFGAILSASEDHQKRTLDQWRLAGLRPRTIVWGRVFSWLLPGPKQIDGLAASALDSLIFWGLVSGALGASFIAVVTQSACGLAFGLGVLLAGALLSLEGGLIGVACACAFSRSSLALLAVTLWVTGLVFAPLFSSIWVGGHWPYITWAWYAGLAVIHFVSGLAAYRAALSGVAG